MVDLKYKPRLISLNNGNMRALIPKSLDKIKSIACLKECCKISSKHAK